ncbi:hypothetical protein BH10PAT2_BH10PAT2_0970 [soil metagenome]
MSDPNQISTDPQLLTQQIAASYVDDYMPPVNKPMSDQSAAPAPVTQSPSEPTPVSTLPTIPMVEIKDDVTPVSPEAPKQESELVVEEHAPLMEVTKAESQILPPEPEQPWPAEKPESPKSSGMPPQTLVTNDTATTPDAAPTPEKPQLEPEVKNEEPEAESETEQKTDSQALESQNIFLMLNIESASEKEKDQFLDELQQIIWEDFLDNDVELLLTEDELVDFKKIQDNDSLNEEERQTAMVDFLENLVPDLEKIMLEKALELKEQMFKERVQQMKLAVEEMPDVIREIEKAEMLIDDQKWLEATKLLNKLAA